MTDQEKINKLEFAVEQLILQLTGHSLNSYIESKKAFNAEYKIDDLDLTKSTKGFLHEIKAELHIVNKMLHVVIDAKCVDHMDEFIVRASEILMAINNKNTGKDEINNMAVLLKQ